MCVLWSAITDCTLSAFTKTAGRDENYYLLLVVLLTNIHFFFNVQFQLLVPFACFSQIVYFYTEFLVLFSSLCSQKYCRCTVFSRNIFLLCLKGHVLSCQWSCGQNYCRKCLLTKVLWFRQWSGFHYRFAQNFCDIFLSVNKILCRFY